MKDQPCNVDKLVPATEAQLRERLARLEGIHAVPVVQDGCQSFQNGLERAVSLMQGREPEYSSDTAEAELDEITQKITNIRDIQGAKETIEAGEYMRGMYNGLELALSIVENREPEYK